MNPSLLALFVLRVAGPAILLLNALALLFIKADPPPFEEQSAVTAVVVRVITPRRKLIITLLSLAAATYFADALSVIIFAIITKQWQGSQAEWRGLALGDFLGLLAFAAIAMICTIKESEGKVVWTRRRVRMFAVLACAFDIAIVFMTAFNVDFRRDGASNLPLHLCDP
jgi:hypothetical protein